jgi:hypothetical protein
MFPLKSVIVGAKDASRYLKGQRIAAIDLKMIENTGSIYSQNLVWAYSETNFLFGLAKIENEMLHTIFNLKEAIALFSSTS